MAYEVTIKLKNRLENFEFFDLQIIFFYTFFLFQFCPHFFKFKALLQVWEQQSEYNTIGDKFFKQLFQPKCWSLFFLCIIVIHGSTVQGGVLQAQHL